MLRGMLGASRFPGAPFLRVNCRELPLMADILSQFLPCQLPWPPPAINLYITCCSDCTSRMLHMSKLVKLFSLRMRSRSSSFASSSLDLRVATFSDLIMQICLIMALSLCGRFILVNGQSSWSMAKFYWHEA